MANTMLHDGWTVRAVGGDVPTGFDPAPIPATVPGCIHLDLMAADRVPDPYLGENEAALGWVGRVDWRYETRFAWAPEESAARVDLVALGLDTFARIELNGQQVAETANQHRSYRFDVSGLLRPGENQLAVTFAAGEPAAYAASERLGPRPVIGNEHPFNAVRKMAANYGWDWGPVLVTAGIWRPLLLQRWDGARIASVRPLVDLDGTTGVLRAHLDLERAVGDDRPLTVAVEVDGVRGSVTVPAGATSTLVELRVPDVRRWWPRGYGDPVRYPVRVTLLDGDAVLDLWSSSVGFRTVRLDTTPDAAGTPFRIVVNDQPVFARGVNWIPDDCFPVRVDRGRYARRLDQATGAGVNLVRVWGGGLYESDDFYDLCDERGLLVWQDFLFACAAYAEEEPLRAEVVAEAREAVTRLSAHPSLVLWNGNNENIWGVDEWGWRAPLADRTWGWGYYTEVLPQIVAELDPTRPYCPGSPYSMAPERPANDEAHGLMHLWEVWNREDYAAYRDARPRFAAEFGWQGPPTWPTLVRSVRDEPLTSDSPALRAHQKADDGMGKLARGLAPHLPEPQSFDDWHWATSLNQARALVTGIEHFRSLTPHCSGAIWWQLNDCWPALSWAVVDGDGRRKPAWYALRRAFADRLVTVQPRGDGLAVVLVNDSSGPWHGTAAVARRGLDGEVRAAAELPFALAARAAATLALPTVVVGPEEPAAELLVVDAGAERAWWSFAEDREARLPEPALSGVVLPTVDGYRVRVTAQTYLKDLALLADRLAADAEVDRMLVSLLPGETAEFVVTTGATLLDGALLDPAVLRSANQLVAGRVLAAPRP